MKKLLIFLFILCLQTAKGQVYQLMPQYGYDTKRMNFDSTLSIPTFCGVPSLRSNMIKKAAVAYDSCNKRFYYYDPKLLAWDTIKGGGASSIDTTSLSNRINQRIDSLRRSGDSVYARKNGVWIFQYKDSVGKKFGSGDSNYIAKWSNSDTLKNSQIYDNGINVGIGTTSPVFKLDVNGDAKLYNSLRAENNSGYLYGDWILSNSGNLNITSGTTTHEYLKFQNTGISPFKMVKFIYDTDGILKINNDSTDVLKIDTAGNITLPALATGGADQMVTVDSLGKLKRQTIPSGGGNGFVPYTGATQDVNLGNNGLTAKFVKVTGTAGDGHIDFKHQSADATAQGNSTVLFANSNGYLKWKNDNLYYSTLATPQTANRVFTTQDKSYTLGDSADIAARVRYTDTSGMLTPYLRKADTSSLSNRINLKLNISDTASMLSPYQRKNISAYSMNVNNTNAAANVTETTYKQFASATYSGTATWTGGTAPSGTTNHSYSWTQVGKLVTLRITLIYGTAGASLTSVSCTLPSDCPSPEEPAGIGAANDVISYGSGVLTTALTATGLATVGMGYSALRVNAADNGYEIVIARASINARYAYATIQYFVP